jgi:hypothetical protein
VFWFGVWFCGIFDVFWFRLLFCGSFVFCIGVTSFEKLSRILGTTDGDLNDLTSPDGRIRIPPLGGRLTTELN